MLTSETKAKTYAELIRTSWKINDDKRDGNLAEPQDLIKMRNLIYGPYGSYNLLDLYAPASARAVKLPVIISVHGGAWMYGDKELYRYYCMDLAEKGFAVVNFNYRLGPEDSFPTMFADLDRLLYWVWTNAGSYNLDRNNLFLTGDSAGAQAASLLATLFTNPEYKEIYLDSMSRLLPNVCRATPAFRLSDYESQNVPISSWNGVSEEAMTPDESYIFPALHSSMSFRAVSLNCGVYDVLSLIDNKDSVLDAFHLYLTSALRNDSEAVRSALDAWSYMSQNFPPAYIATARYDFLKDQAAPMARHLSDAGVKDVRLKEYGTDGQMTVDHDFQCNMRMPEASLCREEECAFFKEFIC